MKRPNSSLMALGLLLVAAGVALRAIVPHHDGGDFFMGLLMGTGIGLEIAALIAGRRSAPAST